MRGQICPQADSQALEQMHAMGASAPLRIAFVAHTVSRSVYSAGCGSSRSVSRLTTP
jgi:hypothetical protein